MPYPALPPELPPLVSVTTAETAHPPSLTESSPSGDASSSFAGESEANQATSQPNRSSAPESFPPQNSGPTPTTQPQVSPAAPPAKQVPSSIPPYASSAALLGDAISIGYLTVDDPVAAASTPSPDSAATVASSQFPVGIKPIATPEQLVRSATLPAADPATPDATAQPPRSTSTTLNSPSYEMSGLSGQLAKLPEKTLMQGLNQAIVFEALAESYDALSQLSAEDLKRLARDRSSQVPQPSSNPAESLPPPSDTLFPGGRIPLAPIPVFPGNREQTTPAPDSPPASTPLPGAGAGPVATPSNVIEVSADRQEYDERRQIFTAEGKVMMRFRNTLLEADRVQVNLPNRLTVAEGNVALTRGRQVLRGQRFEYNFVQGVGTVERARGDIFLPTAGTDTDLSPETVIGDRAILSRPVSDRITSQQRVGNVSSPGGVTFSVGAGRDVNRLPGALPRGGELNRLRFEAERIDFTPEGWEAQNIDITNDPFSPPEFVLRADRAVLTRLSPLEDELVATRPRLVFDQKVAVPLFRRRLRLSRAEEEPSLFRFGFDNEDRGGLFFEGIVSVINTGRVRFSVYPQVYLQRMFIPAENQNSEGIGDLSNYGLRTSLDVFFSDRTALRARTSLTSLDFDEFEDRFRASTRLEQLLLPTPFGFHRLGLEYSYRDRLFNGSLGFQTVQTSLGAVFISPNISLGNTGLVLNYQTGYQLISADTDRLDLLEPIRTDNRVQLGRFQVTAGIGRSFTLWSGKPLPATRNEGLNYTANPLTPGISLSTGLRGVFSQYTSGDRQQDLIGTVGLFAQFGHFSKRFFDYTAIGVSYSQVIGSGASPFLFDRTVDNRILSLSFFQQLFGPVRGGVQTSINLDTREEISTDIFLEYSRRTHGIIVRYNPVLELGSISFRISDFNWTGTAEPFQGAGVVPVEAGVERR
ncbi:MAG: DUF3769 domain-containing protein [Leptolyngbyaceae cyanobacterium bins.349]|nr:DUF3769 domain-containing protein [Leptolyngbyaceae cyanobacterium bins.349]